MIEPYHIGITATGIAMMVLFMDILYLILKKKQRYRIWYRSKIIQVPIKKLRK